MDGGVRPQPVLSCRRAAQHGLADHGAVGEIPASECIVVGSLDSLLIQLKRRHVYRVAVVYAAVGWLVVQIVTQVFPVFSFPTWTEQLAVLLLIGGFPIAMVLAWAYDLRPDGLHRDDESAEHGQRHGHRVDIAIGVLVVAVLGTSTLIWSSHGATAAHPKDRLTTPAVAAAGGAKSIAVLPFENLSDDHANAYFAIGMQEQIRMQLTRLSGLMVVSSGSAQIVQSHPDDLQAVAQQLGVGTLLEGSVQKSGEEARISLQLIDAGTHATLWAETYDRNLSNVFTVESEVAAQVANSLQVRLLPRERRQLAVSPTRNPQAYDALLKGEAAQQRAEVSWQKVDIDAAVAAFQQATSADPQFALAYARLGYAYVWTVRYLTVGGERALLEHSREAFGRALALDPDLPEAHVAAGFYHFWTDGDDAAAGEQFKEALALNPRNAEAQLALGDVEEDRGHLDDALIATRRALTLDPRNVLAWQALASLQEDKRQYTQADKSLLKAVAINPDAGLTWGMRDYNAWFATGDGAAQYAMILSAPPKVRANPTHLVDRALALYRMHEYARALQLFKTSTGSVHSAIWLCGAQADTEWAAGDRAAARLTYRRCIDLTLALPGYADMPWSSMDIGWFYARLGLAQEAERAGLRAVALLPVAQSWDDGGYMLLGLARIWAQLGRADMAVPILDQLLDTDHGQAVSIGTVRTEVEWDPIRRDPAFRQLLRRHAVTGK